MAQKAVSNQGTSPNSVEQTRGFTTSFAIEMLAQACTVAGGRYSATADQTLCQKPHRGAASSWFIPSLSPAPLPRQKLEPKLSQGKSNRRRVVLSGNLHTESNLRAHLALEFHRETGLSSSTASSARNLQCSAAEEWAESCREQQDHGKM